MEINAPSRRYEIKAKKITFYRICNIVDVTTEKGAVTESQLKLFSVDNSALCCYYYSLRSKIILFFKFYLLFYYARWQPDIRLYKQ